MMTQPADRRLLTEAAGNATYAPKPLTTTATEAFAQGIPTEDSVNPPAVLGVDHVTGIVYGISRATFNLSMSGNQGRTWVHGRGAPDGVNSAQYHKIVRFGEHIYLHAITNLDGRAGVYRALAPTSQDDTIQWENSYNLVENSNFNEGTDGWVGWLQGVTLTNPDDGGLFGERYARVAVTDADHSSGAKIHGFSLNGNGTTLDVTPGQEFALSAYVRVTPGRRVRFRVAWGPSGTSYGPFLDPTNGEWQRITYSGVVPEGKSTMRPDVLVDPRGVQNGDTLDVDGVMFVLDTQYQYEYTPQGSSRRMVLMPKSDSSGPNNEVQNGKATCLNASDTAIMLGSYGQGFDGGPSILRSFNGRDWETVWQVESSRHVHAVSPDPYNPGHWWATVGDGSANRVGLLHTPDDGGTWEVVHGEAGNKYQSVQVSFDERYVYLAADFYGSSAFYLDRTEKVIRNLNFGSHTHLPVPGGVGGRLIEIETTEGSKVITSPDLTPFDRGRTIESDNTPLMAANAHLAEPNWLSPAGEGQASLRRAATVSGTTTALIGGDRFFAAAYMGAVDPETGVFYFASMDTSSAGNTYGLFAIAHPGATPVVLDVVKRLNAPPTMSRPLDEVIIHDGMIYCGTRRLPTLAP